MATQSVQEKKLEAKIKVIVRNNFLFKLGLLSSVLSKEGEYISLRRK